jgi:alkylhydroperoxidase/carboxymuconolactone decarboxylase family protein YurZ
MATRPEEVKVVKAFKAAKTAKEMTDAWWTQRPGSFPPPGSSPISYWEKRKPEMVFTYAHNQLTQLIERGILDPKTRYLVIIGCYMMEKHWRGVLQQVCNAKAAGASDEEIMEVAFICAYANSKSKMVETAECMRDVLESPSFKATKRLEE